MAEVQEAQQAKQAKQQKAHARHTQAIEDAIEVFKSSDLPHRDALIRLDTVYQANIINVDQGQRDRLMTKMLEAKQQNAHARHTQAIEDAIEVFKSSNLPYFDALRRLNRVFRANIANLNQGQQDSLMTKIWEAKQARQTNALALAQAQWASGERLKEDFQASKESGEAELRKRQRR